MTLHTDDIQDFDIRWFQALSSSSEIPTENVLQVLYWSKLRDSVLLQTVFAMYDQEIDRHLAMPSCQKLKTMARRRIDQWAHHCTLKTASANFFIQSNLAHFPNDLFCSILTKRFYLVRRKKSRIQMVCLTGENGVREPLWRREGCQFREAPARKHSPSCPRVPDESLPRDIVWRMCNMRFCQRARRSAAGNAAVFADGDSLPGGALVRQAVQGRMSGSGGVERSPLCVPEEARGQA